MPQDQRPRHPVPAPRAPRTPALSPPAPWLSDWAAQQLAVARESASVLARGMETMRRIQEQAVRASLERRAGVSSKTAQQRGSAVAEQAALIRQDFDACARCWRDTAAAALEMNAELLACAMHLVKTEDVFDATSPLVHD
ncbi:MAG: hypothetical protein ACO1PB_19740 [Ramlibacter sp.]